MSDRERLLHELRLGFDGEPWHGTPLLALVDQATPVEAAARPIPGAHTIL